MRFVPTEPVTPKLVAVPFVRERVPRDVAPRTVKVEVTVELDPMNPPYN